MLLGAVALLIFFLPLFLFLQTTLAERAECNAREVLFTQIENYVERVSAECIELVSREIYREFTTQHILKFCEDVSKYQAEKIATISDRELNSLALSVYTQEYNRCFSLLMEQIEKLPCMAECDLSPEEMKFYQGLVLSNSPYRPYRAK